jgi:hypothetical protein
MQKGIPLEALIAERRRLTDPDNARFAQRPRKHRALPILGFLAQAQRATAPSLGPP